MEPAPFIDSAMKEYVRIGVVQWQMRTTRSLDKLLEQAEFFVKAIGDYRSDFCVLPEYFSAPLMAEYNHLGEVEAIRELAKHSPAIREKLSELAERYNVNIIGGSMPIIDAEGNLHNASCLCRRDGSVEITEKLHPTPDEATRFKMTGGDAIRVFPTDSGRIGILICYDVEFPEAARLMADQGLEILFVPFQTDTQNGYNRVRCCSMARAIENECYVVIAGSVGNLPQVHNMDIQYAQSAVFTPSDFVFPVDTIKAEATANAEMTLIADVHMPSLKHLHNHGSVQNLKDRRLDLYRVEKVS